MSTTLYIYAGWSRTGFEGAGLPVAEHLAVMREIWGQEAHDEALQRYAVALMAAASLRDFDARRVEEPAVLYNAENDGTYFVFPHRDGGPVFFVSERPIQALLKWARHPDELGDHTTIELEAGATA